MNHAVLRLVGDTSLETSNDDALEVLSNLVDGVTENLKTLDSLLELTSSQVDMINAQLEQLRLHHQQ